jgi:hypothetical protein
VQPDVVSRVVGLTLLTSVAVPESLVSPALDRAENALIHASQIAVRRRTRIYKSRLRGKLRVRCEGLANLYLSSEYFLSCIRILLSATITANFELRRQHRKRKV